MSTEVERAIEQRKTIENILRALNAALKEAHKENIVITIDHHPSQCVMGEVSQPQTFYVDDCAINILRRQR